MRDSIHNGADLGLPPSSSTKVANAILKPLIAAAVEIISVVEASLIVHLHAACSTDNPDATRVWIPHFAAFIERAIASTGNIPLSCHIDASTPHVENLGKAAPQDSTCRRNLDVSDLGNSLPKSQVDEPFILNRASPAQSTTALNAPTVS